MSNWPGYFTRIFLTTARFAASGWISCVGARHGSLRGRNSRLPQDRRSGLARASAARRARRAAHRMCAVQFALISTICPSFSLNMTGTSKQELKMHAQAQPERPKGEGHGWPEFYSPQMRGKWWSDIEFSLSRLSTAQTPWPRCGGRRGASPDTGEAWPRPYDIHSANC